MNTRMIVAISEADSSWFSVSSLYLTVQIVPPVVILRADKG